MKKLILNIYRVRLYILIVILLGLRIPNLYLPTPFINSSYTVLRVLSLILGVLIVIYPSRPSLRIPRSLVLLLLIYFFFATLSVIRAQNIPSFLAMYKDVVFSLLLFVCAYHTISINNVHKILNGLIVSAFVLVSVEVLFYLYPTFILSFFSEIFNETYLKFFLFQYNRGRYFGDSLNEAMIPLFLGVVSSKKYWSKNIILFLLLSLAITFTVIVSNWRTKAIIFLFSFSSTIFFLTKKKFVHLFLTVVFIFFFITGALRITTVFNGTGGSVLDRFTEDGVDQYGSNSNSARLNYWQDAFSIGNSNLLTGVGLGNYFDALSQESKSNNLSASLGKQFILIDDPHNLFFSAYASTGFLGLISLVSLIFYFAASDIHYLRHAHNMNYTSFCLVFWSMFIYALFNPWLYYQYLGQFWIIRGIVEKLKHSYG